MLPRYQFNGGVTQLNQLSDSFTNGFNGCVTTSSKPEVRESVAWRIVRLPRQFTCANCGKEFMSQQASPKHCSRKCSDEFNHEFRSKTGSERHTWKGGRRLTSDGYVQVYSGVRKTTLEHRVIAERVLGHPLPPNAVIHHVDGNIKNNAPGNLVICQNHAEHRLMHHKKARLDDTGSLSLRRCGRCRIVKELSAFHNRKHVWDGKRSECKLCEENRRRELKSKREQSIASNL